MEGIVKCIALLLLCISILVGCSFDIEQLDDRECDESTLACPAGQLCVDGYCITAAGFDTSSDASDVSADPCIGVSCSSEQECCNGTCVDTSSDPMNCSHCGAICGAGEICALGLCQCGADQAQGRPVCDEGEACCGDECVDVSFDSRHCGGCDQVCDSSNTLCVAGECVCEVGYRTCGMDPLCETDIGSSDAHCGVCDNACDATSECNFGLCSCGLSLCEMNEACCDIDGMGETLCVNINESAGHCGDCNAPCPAGFECTDGLCTCNGLTCDQGDVCCNGACVPGGTCSCGGATCEVNEACCSDACIDTSIDDANCGMCGETCLMDQHCESGLCQCNNPLENCGDVCVHPATYETDPNNCGLCGNACDAGQICCQGMCIDPQNNPANCGACGNNCVDDPNIQPGSAGCSTSVCTYMCLDGFFDCDPATPGCETPRDMTNCTGCGMTCLGNMTTMCCAAGCVDTANDPNNCGMCGNVCAAGEVCCDSTCKALEGGPTECAMDCKTGMETYDDMSISTDASSEQICCLDNMCAYRCFSGSECPML